MNATTATKKIKHFWLYIIAGVASFGGLLSGFDTGVISGALLFINDTWPLTTLEQGWVVSSALIGAVFGAAFNGIFADIYGRKKVIIATGTIFAIGSIICGSARECPGTSSKSNNRPHNIGFCHWYG